MAKVPSIAELKLEVLDQPMRTLVDGKPYQDLPEDLYIPPDALEIFLDAFEGPLDLLLYLIKYQDIDILNIPILKITEQYVDYIEMMHGLRMELAAEYLVMAAMLAEIKSKMLLPRQSQLDEEETDPRAELVRRLLEYERYKKAADDLDALPRLYRDNFAVMTEISVQDTIKSFPDVEIKDLMLAFQDVLKRAEKYTHHQIQREALSVREKMSRILALLNQAKDGFLEFSNLFVLSEGRSGIVVTFLAILELSKDDLLEVVQGELFSDVWLKAVNE